MKPGRRRWTGFVALFTGPAIWWGTVLLIPYSLMFAHSFYTTQFPFFVADFQFGNYLQIITDSQYFLVIWRSVKIALMVSLVTFALSFPLTYFVVFKVRSPRLRMALYMATIVPLWVSYLLRAYTWKTILGTEGILNSLLIWTGIIDEPIQLFLYNQFAMVIMCRVRFFMVDSFRVTVEVMHLSLYRLRESGSRWGEGRHGHDSQAASRVAKSSGPTPSTSPNSRATEPDPPDLRRNRHSGPPYKYLPGRLRRMVRDIIPTPPTIQLSRPHPLRSHRSGELRQSQLSHFAHRAGGRVANRLLPHR